MREEKLLSEFTRVAQTFNKDLRLIPTLYGSLGLWRVSNVSFNADDIDVLVPETYLKSGWKELCATMSKLGYELKDGHEHKFGNGTYEIGIAYVEDLDHFADVDYRAAECVRDAECVYYQFGLADYQKIYSQSLKDSYRKENKGDQDSEKLAVIGDILSTDSRQFYDQL